MSATKVGLANIETVNVASNGTGFVANTLSLDANAGLKTLNITGDKALTLSFTGTQGVAVPDATKGVSLIDGSTATGKLEITLTNINAVTGGLTVKGGSAGDVITTQAGLSSSLSGNGGNDSFVVTATTAGTGTATDLILAANAKITTITDFTAGDKITGATLADSIAKIDIGTVGNLDAAFDLLATNAASTDVQWFNYGSDTYVVYNDATAKLSEGDTVIKLAGVIDLSNATMTAGVLELA